MRSFFHKDFSFQHKYPIKVWSAGVIDDIPYSVSFDGSTLRQVNLFTKKVAHSFDYHHLNAFSICLYMSTNIYKYENLFLLVKNQRFIEIYDCSLKHVPQFDYDTGSAIITVHWHKPSDRLFTCGTNGWLRCFKVTTKHKVTEFVAEWNLLWEIRSTPDWIISLAHDDFTQLLYGAAEGSIYAWDLNTGDFKYRLPQMHNKFKICQVEVDPESSVVITSGLDGYIRTWDIKELECKNLNSFEVAPKGHVSFSMIGRQIVTIGKDRIIKFFGISDSTLRCSVAMADPTKKVNFEEVVNPQLVVLDTQKGNICVTSYKDQIQTALLSFAPEEILSTDSTVSSMDFDWKEKNLLCLCSNNFVVASREKGKSTTIDLDVPNTNQCKRCCVSEVLCFVVNGDILYAGFKNGSVKCINLRRKECIMLDQVPIDEPIVFITIVHGLFLFNHPMCGEIQPIKTSNSSPFIVCYTEKGNINVWCARCHTHLLTFEIGKKQMTCLKLIPEKSLLLISAQKVLTIYNINAYDFIPVGEITTSGNQFITSFEMTNQMELIAGTSSGEVMILQVEEGNNELHFHLEHHLALDAGIFRIYFNPLIGKPVICLSNGSLIAMNQTTAKIISRSNHVDSEPLTSVYFKYDPTENKVGAYLSFGSRIHFAPIDTYEEPIVAKKEEEEEEEEKKEVEKDDNEDKEEKIIRYYEESQLNISRLMNLFQKEKQKKKRHEYIPEMESNKTPQTQEDLPNKRSQSQNSKLSFNEVMAKNRNAIQEALGIFDYSRPSSASTKKNTYSYSKNKFNSENSDYNRQNSDDNSLNLMVTPFFYTDLPENSRVMVPSPKKTNQSENEEEEKIDSKSWSSKTSKKLSYSASLSSRNNLGATEKSLVYDEGNKNGFQAAIDKNDNVERTTPDYIPPGGRFVLQKLKKEPVKAPTIIRKIFVGPPQSSRVLFNDPSTLNGLNFFDPRGFQSRFGESEIEESSNANLSSASSSRNEKEEEEEETESESENELAFLAKKKLTDLEKRRLLKKKRVSITSLMNPQQRPKTSQQVKRRFTNGYVKDTPLKAKPIQTPKTPQSLKKNSLRTSSSEIIQVQRPKVKKDTLSNKNPQPTPPILITNAHLNQKEKESQPIKQSNQNQNQNKIKNQNQDQIQKQPEKPSLNTSNQENKDDSNNKENKNDKNDKNINEPKVEDKNEETKISDEGKDKSEEPITIPEIKKDEVKSNEKIEDKKNEKSEDNNNEKSEDNNNEKSKDKSNEKSEDKSNEKSEDNNNEKSEDTNSNEPQSPKHVQFIIPGKTTKSDETESTNSDSVKSPTESEIEVDLPIIDIKLRHEFQQRRRRVKNQPIHLEPQESTLASYIKNKHPDAEKSNKQHHVPPKDENESVKASMMSPKLSKKNSSSSSSQASFDKVQQKRKKKNKNSSKSYSGGMSEASSTADSSESNVNSIQDDVSSQNENKKTQLSAEEIAILKDEEQARINQERRKRLALGEDGFLFGGPDKEKFEKIPIEKTEAKDEMKCYFPQLKNLQKFWEQKIVFPILPFEFGDPNTAKCGEGTLFDDAIEKVSPIQNFHLFAGTEKNGVNDLVRRFQKISAFNSGERDNIDDVFEADTDEDILENLPSFKRRLSF